MKTELHIRNRGCWWKFMLL